MDKKTILVSACLLGENCKYNGLNNYQEKYANLKDKYNVMGFSVKEVLSAFMVLFAIIDIIGSIPIILDIKNKVGDVQPMKVTVVALVVFLAFLFIGDPLLGIFGIDVSSFAIAGSFIIFVIGVEMVLGVNIIKYSEYSSSVTIITTFLDSFLYIPGCAFKLEKY